MRVEPAVERWLVGFDLHYPRVSWPTWRAMLACAADVKPTGFIFGGDQFDNECISRHTEGLPLLQPEGQFLKDEEGFAKDILASLEQVLPTKAARVWVRGNHDLWETEYIEKNPKLKGMTDRRKNLKLAEKGWQIIDIGHSYRLGKLRVMHGEWLGGQFSAKKAVEVMSSNILVGHTHTAQSFTKIAPVEHTQRWMGWVSPILGATNANFMRNRPNAWVNGFNLVEVRKGGNFNLYPIIVSEGACAYGGKLYRAA